MYMTGPVNFLNILPDTVLLVKKKILRIKFYFDMQGRKQNKSWSGGQQLFDQSKAFTVLNVSQQEDWYVSEKIKNSRTIGCDTWNSKYLNWKY